MGKYRRDGGCSRRSVLLPCERVDPVASPRLGARWTPLVMRLGEAETEAVPLTFVDAVRCPPLPFAEGERGVEQDEVDSLRSPLGIQPAPPLQLVRMVGPISIGGDCVALEDQGAVVHATRRGAAVAVIPG